MASLNAALLLAVPLTLDEFLSSIARGRDYTRRYAADPGSAWTHPSGYRESVARPIKKLVDEASALGVSVFETATLGDLANATSRYSTVIVFAHWKGPEIAPTDLLVRDARVISQRLAMSGDPHLRRLAQKLKRVDEMTRVASLLDGCAQESARRMVRDAGRRRHGIRIDLPMITARARARRDIEQVLGDAITAGERLELVDGLHDAGSIDLAIAPDFVGVLDFTTCTSVLLTAQLEQTRSDAFRVVQFVETLKPDVAALTLRQTLHQLHTADPIEYLAARARAINEVAQALAVEAHKSLRR